MIDFELLPSWKMYLIHLYLLSGWKFLEIRGTQKMFITWLNKWMQRGEQFPETRWFWLSSKTCFVVVQSLNCVWLFVTPWTAARQASLSFTISQSLFKLMSIKSMMLSNHLILFHPFAFNLPQHLGLFQWVVSLHQVAKVLELQLQHQSFQWRFRVDFL